MRAIGVDGNRSNDVVRLGLLCADSAAGPGSAQAVDGNPLDLATAQSPVAALVQSEVDGYDRVAVLPFDHERAMTSVVVRDRDSGATTLIVKGAPEAVLARCADRENPLAVALEAELAAGHYRLVGPVVPPARPRRVRRLRRRFAHLETPAGVHAATPPGRSSNIVPKDPVQGRAQAPS